MLPHGELAGRAVPVLRSPSLTNVIGTRGGGASARCPTLHRLRGRARSPRAQERTFGGCSVRGEFEVVRPLAVEPKGPTTTDESTGNQDSIEWVLGNVEGHNGKVGQWGISPCSWLPGAVSHFTFSPKHLGNGMMRTC